MIKLRVKRRSDSRLGKLKIKQPNRWELELLVEEERKRVASCNLTYICISECSSGLYGMVGPVQWIRRDKSYRLLDTPHYVEKKFYSTYTTFYIKTQPTSQVHTYTRLVVTKVPRGGGISGLYPFNNTSERLDSSSVQFSPVVILWSVHLKTTIKQATWGGITYFPY